MADQYDNTNRGALFKVAEKKERGPDYDGTLDVGGKPYRIAAWIRESRAGTKFMSLTVSEKTAEAKERPAPAKIIDPDGDIPF